MFGLHELKTQFIKIGREKIHLLEESRGFVRYRRGGIEKLVKKAPGGKMGIFPAPAVGYGVALMMIVLKEPLVVPPGGIVRGFLEAPVEVEIKAGNLTLDRFSPGREKYALYGPIEGGVIARYQVSPLHPEEPDSQGILPVLIRNETREWKELSKVVVPIRRTAMHYSPERGYYPLVQVTMRNAIPEVNNTGLAHRDGLNPVGTPKALPNFLMRW